MKRCLAFAAIVVSGVVSASAQKARPVPVFVTSGGTINGFTDPSKDNRDTVSDLWDELKGYKSLKRAEDRDSAVIVLTVMGRETAQVTAGFLGAAARDRIIRLKFTTKDLETELTASAQGGTLGSGGAWTKAAGKLMKQVNEWVLANRSKLPE